MQVGLDSVNVSKITSKWWHIVPLGPSDSNNVQKIRAFHNCSKILSIVQRYDGVQCSGGDWKGIPVPNGLAAFQLGGNINQGISTPICILCHHGRFTILIFVEFFVGLRHYLKKSYSYWLIQLLQREYKLRDKTHAIHNWHGNSYFTFGLFLNLSGSSSKVKVRLL